MVTLVESKGSTYRRQGAKMIVSQEKQMVGAISGGCLENDVAEYAKMYWRKEVRNLLSMNWMMMLFLAWDLAVVGPFLC